LQFIQTLRIPQSSNPFQTSFGWAAPEFHLMSWTLSCLQLKKIHGNIVLYGCSDAAKLLVDVIGLPYDDAYITHDNCYLPDERLWALPKIHTYLLQKQPFLHLDGDVYLFQALPSQLLESGLIAQNIEEATEYYTSTQKELMKHLVFLPPSVKKDFYQPEPISAVNAGILGGNNIGFINEYAQMALQYVKKNQKHLPKFDVDKFNVFFEQHLFYSMAFEQAVPIGLLFNERVKDNQYKDLASFHEVSYKKNYLHLLGHFKRDKFTCLQLAATLRSLYPNYYYKIISLFKKQALPLFCSFYNQVAETFLSNSFAAKAAQHFEDCTVNLNDNENFASPGLSATELLAFPEIHYIGQVAANFIDSDDSEFNKFELNDDLIKFTEQLSGILAFNRAKISPWYLYGRDLDAIHWYPQLFGTDALVFDRIIEKCNQFSIIDTQFDWAGIARSNHVEGRAYYQNLTLTKGTFYNLVVPEIFGNGFSLFDIDETEKLILDELSIPQSISELLTSLRRYIDDDVLDNHLEYFNQLFILQIQQLVLKKVIKPFCTQNT
jgi:hypothetical protein